MSFLMTAVCLYIPALLADSFCKEGWICCIRQMHCRHCLFFLAVLLFKGYHMGFFFRMAFGLSLSDE